MVFPMDTQTTTEQSHWNRNPQSYYKSSQIAETNMVAEDHLSSDFYDVPNETMTLIRANRQNVDRLLSLNINNRKLNYRQVLQLKRSILLGNWKLVGSVIVSKTGILLDGQHRLHAIREADYYPVKFWLNRGVDEAVRMAIDQGRSRSIIEALTFNGVESVNKKVIQAINFLHRLAHDTLTPRTRLFVSKEKGSEKMESSYALLSTDDMQVFHEDLTSKADISNFDNFFKQNHPLRIAPVYSALFQYAVVNPERAKQIADALAAGEGLSSQRAIHHFRNFALRSDSNRKAKVALYRRLISAILYEHRGASCSKLAPEARNWAELADEVWTPKL